MRGWSLFVRGWVTGRGSLRMLVERADLTMDLWLLRYVSIVSLVFSPFLLLFVHGCCFVLSEGSKREG